MQQLDIIYEDNHLLVVNKQAGIATMGAESGPTLHSLACNYIKEKYRKPGNVYLGIVSRLDAMTSGVIVMAKTSKAASRLSSQFANRDTDTTNKLYLALVEGTFVKDTGQEWSDRVYKDDAAHRMRVAHHPSEAAKLASLRFHALTTQHDWSLIAIRLLTGRKHQIRLQFSDRGHAILGDRKYGSHTDFPNGIALHSWSLTLTHPTKKERMTFRSVPPKSWQRSLKQIPVENQFAFDASLADQLENKLKDESDNS